MHPNLRLLVATAAVTALTVAAAPVGGAAATRSSWQTVVNTNDPMPNSATGRTFNSFNQPSVNASGHVVFRARSRGGQPGEGPPTRGIFIAGMTRDGEILTIAGGETPVPEPSNVLEPPEDLPVTFIEFPSIPRIGIRSDAVATRGNHRPVWEYELGDGSETRVGTTGIYVDLDDSDLITGASKLGAVPADGLFDFGVFSVPGVDPPIAFDVFPGAPSITDGGTIVFKGNYTDGVPKTGVFYRELESEPAGGPGHTELIANSDTEIPDPASCPVGTHFGSTAPPSAADGTAVFVGLDDEESPACGGIYLAPLEPEPTLASLVRIGSAVPEVQNATFTRLGEGVSYDGRFVAFWGAWGNATRIRLLECPTEGNADRIAFCEEQFPEGFEAEVPVHQGIFVHDVRTGRTRMVARTGSRFDDFVYWNFSGRVPGGSEGDDDGEPARWRSSAFVAASGQGAAVRVAFKARSGEVDGIYLGRKPGRSAIVTLVDTTMAGQELDPEAPDGSRVTELDLERDGFRGRWLVISAKMSAGADEEEEGLAGIYRTPCAGRACSGPKRTR